MIAVPTKIKNVAGRHSLAVKNHAPQALFVAGIAGTILSTVLACRATLKLEEKLSDFSEEVKSVKGLKPSIGVEPDNPNFDMYTRSSYGKDLLYVYAKNTGGLVRLYGPSFVVGGLAIAALTTSHATLTRRNAGLTAAYSALQMGLDSYRDRVRAEIGEEKELDLYRGISYGKTKDGEELDRIVDVNGLSPYCRIFDETSPEWKKNAELNRIFVQCQQNYANQLLQARGHVFLNEVYDRLGLPRSAAGAVVGWALGEHGDNYIDFGIFEARNAAFVNGRERSIWLDFNVDGVILNSL